MKLFAKIRYFEKYLPTKRHRIPRLREKEEVIEVELREITKEDISIACIDAFVFGIEADVDLPF